MTALGCSPLAPRRPLPVPLVLGLKEGRRIVQHPVALVGFALMTLAVLPEGDNGPRGAFEALSAAPTFFYGVFVYFAANLVASRDRRAHSGELLVATPSPATARVAGLCVGAWVPTLVCAAFVATVHAVQAARGLYEVSPSVWHLSQGPLTVLGGALLGIMVARLTRVPGVALLVMVAMFAVNLWLQNTPSPIQPLGTFVSWARYAPGTGWAGTNPGSPAWHVAYLAGLCAMAACGAFVREARHPWRVVGIGASLTALAVVPALLQLP